VFPDNRQFIGKTEEKARRLSSTKTVRVQSSEPSTGSIAGEEEFLIYGNDV
jgi:hypothetical protein